MLGKNQRLTCINHRFNQGEQTLHIIGAICGPEGMNVWLRDPPYMLKLDGVYADGKHAGACVDLSFGRCRCQQLTGYFICVQVANTLETAQE